MTKIAGRQVDRGTGAGQVAAGDHTHSGWQPSDATLTALAGLATGADKVPYSTGTDTFAQADLTSFARTLLDDADAATARGTLGIDAATATYTNKRITKRAGSTTSTATLTYDSDAYDVYTITAQAAALSLANPSGTPTDGQPILIRVKDNGTARALTWSGSQWLAVGVDLPTTTVSGKWLVILAVWEDTADRWHVVHVGQET